MVGEGIESYIGWNEAHTSLKNYFDSQHALYIRVMAAILNISNSIRVLTWHPSDFKYMGSKLIACMKEIVSVYNCAPSRLRGSVTLIQIICTKMDGGTFDAIFFYI